MHANYKMVLTDKSWHGFEDAVVSRDISVEDGCNLAQMADVIWETRPAYVEVEPGRFVPIQGKHVLVRLPTPWDDTYHPLGNRLVKNYQIVENPFLCGLAQKMADVTGWTFEGAGTLKKGEISFIQLRLTNDFYVGGKIWERHNTKFIFGDDKRGGSGYGGLVFTRIQCYNTWRAAIAEDGVFRIKHLDDPHAQWEFVQARVDAAINSWNQQQKVLDHFFFTSIAKQQFREFVETTFPTPSVPKAIVDAEEARGLLADGHVEGDKLAHILFRGEKAQSAYENDYALAERRREGLNKAYAVHNASHTDSAETLYAAWNGLTWLANHGESNVFRGNATQGLLFNGTRGQFVERGYNVLKNILDQ